MPTKKTTQEKRIEIMKTEESKYINPDIESSYKENDIGQTLYNLVMSTKPTTIVEYGTLYGYSAVAMAQALRDLSVDGIKREIICYDLWDEYKFKKASKDKTQETIDKLGLSEYVVLKYGDILHTTPPECQLIHIDVSNDGSVLSKIDYIFKNNPAMVIFEGGIPERDKVQWMSKYNKQPMGSCGVRYDIINPKFPGLSVLLK